MLPSLGFDSFVKRSSGALRQRLALFTAVTVLALASAEACGNGASPELPLSPAIGTSIFASLALAERGFGVAWADNRYDTMGDNSEIYFARLCP